MWEYWKAVPMRHWETRYNGLGTDERMKLCDSAAQAATWLARLSAYVSRRMSGGKHGDAVKAQNRAARRVRQALGYTYADDKVTF
jgi:hypothetical protein